MLARDLLSGLKVADRVEASPVSRLLVGGDVCPIGRVGKQFLSGRHLDVWGDVQSITADHSLSIADLECPLTNTNETIVKSGPHLKADPGCAEGVRGGGFDVVTLANNHIMDSGEQGLLDTFDACSRAGLATVGAGSSAGEAARPLVVEVDRLRVAIVAAADAEFATAVGTGAGANGLDPIDLHAQIARAREVSDFVLASLHVGQEYFPYPSPGLRKLCRFIASSGASAVVCCHIHVPGGVEIFNGVPILYSLGNLLFDWSSQRPDGWYRGYLASLEICRRQVTSLRLIPFEQCRTSPAVTRLEDSEAMGLAKEVARVAEVIADDERLSAAWSSLAKRRRLEFVGPALGLGRIGRRLLRLGIWPTRSFIRRRLPTVLNYASSEGHRELMVEVLREELSGEHR